MVRGHVYDVIHGSLQVQATVVRRGASCWVSQDSHPTPNKIVPSLHHDKSKYY